jgi:hypothetical protein
MPGNDRASFTSGSFHFQTNRDFVDFALPCQLHCQRLVFASQSIWKWNRRTTKLAGIGLSSYRVLLALAQHA